MTEDFNQINIFNQVFQRICNAERKMVVKEALLANKIIVKKKYNLEIDICFHISRCTINIGGTNPRNES